MNEPEKVNFIVKKLRSKNPVLITGFPGIGLVGNIVSQYTIDQLKLRQIGSIDSKLFPPIAVLFAGLVNVPARIYEGDELIVVVSDIPISPTISHDLSKALVDWAQRINARELVSIAGIATLPDEHIGTIASDADIAKMIRERTKQRHRIFGVATAPSVLEKLKGKVSIFGMGTVAGIAGSIMTECSLRNFPAICLLSETYGTAPDPRAAVEVIKVLNSLYGVDIDTEKLLGQAERIELGFRRLAEQVRKTEEPEVGERGLPLYG
ncbi:MAG: proteasome assembly chaperone family protein [Methanocellales archaeon]|nr:proteasome assembly chaperone family protein [Methanocellales archaeon]